MAEKEVLIKEEKPVIVEANKRPQPWVMWTVIGGFVILILLVIGIIYAKHVLTDRAALSTGRQQTQITMRGGFGEGYRQSTFYSQSSSTDGPTTTTTTQKYTYTEGVVTQVNSGNIVVAGNGKTQTITTNSSTTYDTTKPAVNDTVRIVGTADSNNAVTATEVAVTNN